MGAPPLCARPRSDAVAEVLQLLASYYVIVCARLGACSWGVATSVITVLLPQTVHRTHTSRFSKTVCLSVCLSVLLCDSAITVHQLTVCLHFNLVDIFSFCRLTVALAVSFLGLSQDFSL